MNLLVLTKSKIYTTSHGLTFDGLFTYTPDAYLGISWGEINELLVVGFETKEDFDGQKLKFPTTGVRSIGIGADYWDREKNLSGRLRNALALFWAIIKSRKALKNIDLLFTAYFEYSGFMMLAVKIANPRIKMINDVITDYPLWNFSKRKSHVQRVYLLLHQYFTYLLSDQVWFISHYLMQKYSTHKGRVIYNSPVNHNRIGMPKKLDHEKIKLLFVGRFADEKIPDVPVLVLNDLKKRGIRASLRFVGEGPLRPEMENLIQSLGLNSEVEFAGRILDRDRLFDIFKESDFFLFPSLLGEALGFVALEAMSQGVVVLGTASGGIREVIKDGYNGVLIPPESIERKDHIAALLAERAAALISEPMRYEAISRYAIESIENLTIEKCAEAQRASIEELLAK